LPVDLTIDMTIDRQLGPAIDLNVKGDSTFAYGYGTEIGKNLSAGVTAKYVHRVAVEQSVSALELAADPDVLSSKRFKEGQLIDFDIGFLWSPSWFGQEVVKVEKPDGLKVESKLPPAVNDEKKEETREPQAEASKTDKVTNEPALTDSEKADAALLVGKPEDKKTDEKTETKSETSAQEISKDRLPLTLGVVMHNVLGGSFSKTKMVNKDATEAPAKMDRVVDVGSQYILSELGDLTIRSMLDFKNLLHPEITLNKATHIGIEFDYSPSGWFKSQIRGGFNQMYYTAGTTLLLGIVNIDIVTYGEEVGTTTAKIENRVYAAKLGMNF
jgi:hypothetical protein